MIIDLLNRYLWIVDTILSAGTITRDELNRRWAQSSRNEKHESFIPVRTFHHDREAIAILFKVDIECDKHRNVYYIANAADILQDGLCRWLLSSFSVKRMIDESAQLRDQIVYEEIPTGQQYLTTFVTAMRDKQRLLITHTDFKGREKYTTLFSPFCIKVFKQRWYVVGMPDRYPGEMRVYAFDRLSAVEPTEEHYDLPEDFTAQDFFKYTYGVYHSRHPEEILVKVFKESVPYLDSLPLHWSQEKMEQQEDFCIYRFYLDPKKDFKMALFSLGPDVEVLSPLHFRNEFIDAIRSLNEIYHL